MFKNRKGLTSFAAQVIMFGVLVLALLLGWWLAGSALPAEYQNVTNGFSLVGEIFETNQGNARALLVDLLILVALPFAFIFTLLWGVMNAATGNYFSKRVTLALAVILSLGLAASTWFITLAAVVFGMGGFFAAAVGIYAVILIIWDAFHSFSSEARRVQREHMEDVEIEREAEDVDDRIKNIINNERDDVTDAALIEIGQEAKEAELHQKELLEDVADRAQPKANNSDTDGRLKQLIKRKVALGEKFQRRIASDEN